MCEDLLFPGISCDVCTEREAVIINEKYSGIRTSNTYVLLWTSPFGRITYALIFDDVSYLIAAQKEQQEAREAALAAEGSEDDDELNATSNKSARAYAKTYHTGPPLVPALIVNRIVSYIAKVTLRKKHEFVYTLCRYWSLKREARRGAPLLKRLHLEPWTTTAGMRIRSNREKMMKLDVSLFLG